MTDDHARAVEFPLDCTIEQLTQAVIGCLGDHVGTKANLSRNTINEIRRGKRKLTRNTFTKIVRAYVPEERWEAWEEAWKRATSTSTSSSGTPAPPVTPQQLPPVVADFIEREAQFAELAGADSGPGRAGIPIVAITGEPGVGKTALAISWAHRTSADFPDGQLYVNLRGYDPDEPLPAENALAGFLDALGVVRRPEADRGELTAQFRTAVAGKRVSILLDNASNAEHVRPLLPGTPESRVIVTSRDSLAGLVVGEGARPLRLSGLSPGEARQLLRALIGPRADDDGTAADELAELCAMLPLLLRIAAVRVDGSPTRSITALVGELSAESALLDGLETGNDDRTAIRSVLSWSYKHLADPVKSTLRMVGLHPGQELDVAAVAALTGVGRRDAKRCLDALVGANLLTAEPDGRYGTHDVLRAWAAEMAQAEDDARTRADALTRLFDHYLDSLSSADPEERRAWLRREHDNLIAAATHMAKHGRHRHLIAMSSWLGEHLAVAGYPGQAIVLHRDAVASARVVGDTGAQAEACLALGTVQWRTGRYPEAERSFQSSLDLSRALGNRGRQGRALVGLGSTYAYRGAPEQALKALAEAEEVLGGGEDPVALGMALGTTASVHHALGDIATSVEYLHRAADIFRERGDRVRYGRAMGNLGVDHYVLGENSWARDCFEIALGIHQEVGDRSGEGRAHLGLGRLPGDPAEAHEHLRKALGIFEDTEDHDGSVSTLSALGVHHRERGDLDQALTFGQRACDLADRIGEQESRAKALNDLGETLRARGRHDDARKRHAEALGIAEATGNQCEQACAHVGLGRVLAADAGRAKAHLTEALEIRRRLGVPGVDEIEELLEVIG